MLGYKAEIEINNHVNTYFNEIWSKSWALG